MLPNQQSTESNPATRALRAPAPPADSLVATPAAALPESLPNARPTVSSADIRRDDLTGLFLGPYALGVKLGGGGMGKVFRARHLHLNRELAVKFVATEISAHPEAQLRFEQEIHALGQLQHPHIVNAVDAGHQHGLKYLVTEYIAGEDLARLVRRGGVLPPQVACELMRQAARGLDYLHRQGFIHRDLKPSNLIVDSAGMLKLLDFGLVHGGTADQQLTDAGTTLGTWDYLAPEQAHDSSQVDHRCDLYSLGCTLLFLLSGQAPFADAPYATPAAKLKGHLFDPPRWLEHPPDSMPGELIELLRKLLAKSPDQRYQSAADVEAELSRLAAPPEQSASASAPKRRGLRGKRLAAGAIAAAVVFATAYCWQPASGSSGSPSATTPEPTANSAAENGSTATGETAAAIPSEHTSVKSASAPDLVTAESTQTKSAAPPRLRLKP